MSYFPADFDRGQCCVEALLALIVRIASTAAKLRMNIAAGASGSGTLVSSSTKVNEPRLEPVGIEI
jgi:hypothetical protein